VADHVERAARYADRLIAGCEHSERNHNTPS
jgi:hypothetical protein